MLQAAQRRRLVPPNLRCLKCRRICYSSLWLGPKLKVGISLTASGSSAVSHLTWDLQGWRPG